jgi:hypothetical protein
MSDEATWEYLRTLTYTVTDLAGALLPLVNDDKQFARLRPFYDNLRKLTELHAEHCRAEPAEDGPSTAELHKRLGDIEEHVESRKRDSDRPIHVKVIDTRKKQDEKV